MKRVMMMAVIFVLVIFCGAGAAPAAFAQSSNARAVAPSSGDVEPVPHLVQFSATLKDAAARPVAGVASVTFAIYAEQEGGTPLWSETQNVLADASGHFSVLLGAASAAGVPVELFGTGQSRWLGVTVARAPEMPRVLLASVPYALKAGDAQTLGGLPASAYVTTENLASKLAHAPMSTAILAPGGAANTASAAETSAQAGGAAAPATISNATPTGSGTTDFIPLWTSSSALGNSLLFQTGGNVGINTKTPTETLDVNGNSIFRGSFQLPPGHDATASSGFESHSFQFQASSFNSTTKTSNTEAFGFRAEPLNNNTTEPSAKLDLFFGAGGSAPFTDTGFSFAANGIVTFAPGQSFFGTTVTTNTLDLPTGNQGATNMITAGGVPFLSTTGSQDNLFFGLKSGLNVPANGGSFANTAIGALSMSSLTTGSDNTAVGDDAMNMTTVGHNNVAIGAGALFENVSGSDNVVVGAVSGELIATGSANTVVGEAALNNVVSGTSNVALGDSAGVHTTGTSNTLLGAQSDIPAGVSNATAIGFGAVASQDHSLVLGGTGAQAVNVGIGTSSPRSQLEIDGPSGISFLSTSPTLTMTGTDGGVMSIDFNPNGISTSGTYNPQLRMGVLNDGQGSATLAFYANVPGAGLNNGLQQVFAVASNGDARVSGNLSKASGSFKIDDPIDPANKYLSHSFVESPDMMNIYNGTVHLDAKGQAVVEMPEWFSALNRDFQYQLTAIGAPAPRLYIAEKMQGNHFRIAGGKKGQEVSWMVTGIRQDAWANAHRIPTEEAKPANEQGTYLHPELFGAGPDKQVGAVAASAPANAVRETKSTAVPGAE
jgi:trimeric autotransporter adhesin